MLDDLSVSVIKSTPLNRLLIVHTAFDINSVTARIRIHVGKSETPHTAGPVPNRQTLSPLNYSSVVCEGSSSSRELFSIDPT